MAGREDHFGEIFFLCAGPKGGGLAAEVMQPGSSEVVYQEWDHPPRKGQLHASMAALRICHTRGKAQFPYRAWGRGGLKGMLNGSPDITSWASVLGLKQSQGLGKKWSIECLMSLSMATGEKKRDFP